MNDFLREHVIFAHVGDAPKRLTLDQLIAKIHGLFDENASRDELFASETALRALDLAALYEARSGNEASHVNRQRMLTAEFCLAKGQAAHYRAKGAIDVAIRLEGRADSLYSQLDSAWRW